MDKMTLTTKLINAIMQYLGTKPFVEVIGLITEVQKQAADQGAIPTELSKETPKES